MKPECSFTEWFPSFGKESLEAVVVPLPNEVTEYLEHGSFRLPVEATEVSASRGSMWSDGTRITNDNSDDDSQSTDDEGQPTFPEFSKQIQNVLNDFGAVFVKFNWSAPSDAAWVAPTKTLRCTTLEEIYLLLKSSDRVAKDLNDLEVLRNSDIHLQPSLILKKWREINPCTEFRCFVIQGELVGSRFLVFHQFPQFPIIKAIPITLARILDCCFNRICQRDLSQYYRYIESEKYDIRQDIKSLFNERIKKGFQSLKNYTLDVIRYRKDHVKIIDFGPYFPATTKTLLFTSEELAGLIDDPPEFRFIGENIAIQPNDARHFCMPREINEFYETNNRLSAMDIIQREVENQEEETRGTSQDSHGETDNR